ncbi:IkappaB kinase complex, IKAP component [Peniophora sp. CONT]|nr:IkappaB kinase complex, IKAP component [Peniophora sp. CONT]
MRNLALTSAYLTTLPSSSSSKTRLSASSIDTDSSCLWLATEHFPNEEEVELTIWRQSTTEEDDLDGNGAPIEQVGVLNTQRAKEDASQVVSLHALPDVRTLVLVARGGDIATLSLDDVDEPIQVVGTLDGGVLCASWSPDDSSLALITGEDKLLLLSPTLDVLSESTLHTKDFGENAPINVGWGSKSTQFHGSVGKEAAKATTREEEVGSAPDDDGVPRISWRPDGVLFVVSALSPPSNVLRRRVLRVYGRNGALEATSEAVPGLEGALATGSGNAYIASTQRFGGFAGSGRGKEGRHDVVFFERNGLRHGEFRLREPVGTNYRVKEMRWSADGSVLAVWIGGEGEEVDRVQLWTSGNWHWYLKLEIRPPGGATTFEDVAWHPEHPLELILCTSDAVLRQNLAWETVRSRTKVPHDTGTVAVLDGSDVLLTPFRTSNIPPPMSAHRLSLPHRAPPAHLSLSLSSDLLGLLWDDGKVLVYDLNTRIKVARGEVDAMQPVKVFEGRIGGKEERSVRWREIGFVEEGKIAAIGMRDDRKEVYGVVSTGEQQGDEVRLVELEGAGWAFVRGDGEGVEVHNEGKVLQLSDGGITTPIANFGRACTRIERSGALLVGLSGSTLLAGSSTVPTPPADDDPSASRALSNKILTLATNATSFALTPEFVIWTNAAHEAHFVSPEEVLAVLEATSADAVELKTEKRRIERGARIVVPVPSATALVLQMPRGNLETVHPRPMVGAVVRADVARGAWRAAFLACRKHRMDLALLATDGFENAVPEFVAQIGGVDHFNLFLTALGQSTLPAERVAVLCDALRAELKRVDLRRYINAVLTAHVVKRPPDMEGALGVLLALRESEPALVEDAVKYVIFLVDANTLFDVALGMYDFALVLMIAQYAQKDPREYLPFLRELRALPPSYQRFKIDDHLRRPSSALRNLRQAGPEHFSEALKYTADHGLYKLALELWRDDERYSEVLSLWGDDLFERREFGQAAVVFVEAGATAKARASYERALLWRELFALGGLDEEETIETAHRIADDLQAKKRALEAGTVLLDYARDVRAAVSALAAGNEFSEARRVAVLHTRSELVEEIVHPATLDARAQIGEDISEASAQLSKQRARLAELRLTKAEAPAAFYGADADDPALANVDVMTDASAFTAFTRYTVAPSATSSKATSKRSSRSKRKMERKVGSGRKGTVDEEEYLLNSLVKLSGRVKTMQDEAAALVPHLVAFTTLHRSEARELTEEMEGLARLLEEAVREAWPEGEGGEEESEVGWAKRMEEYVKDRERAVKSIKRPEVGKAEWRVKLVDFVEE